MLANLMFQRGEIEQALHHFKQLFAKKPGILQKVLSEDFQLIKIKF